jgi:hypothetical protein
MRSLTGLAGFWRQGRTFYALECQTARLRFAPLSEGFTIACTDTVNSQHKESLMYVRHIALSMLAAVVALGQPQNLDADLSRYTESSKVPALVDVVYGQEAIVAPGRGWRSSSPRDWQCERQIRCWAGCWQRRSCTRRASIRPSRSAIGFCARKEYVIESTMVTAENKAALLK